MLTINTHAKYRAVLCVASQSSKVAVFLDAIEKLSPKANALLIAKAVMSPSISISLDISGLYFTPLLRGMVVI